MHTKQIERGVKNFPTEQIPHFQGAGHCIVFQLLYNIEKEGLFSNSF